MSRTTRLLIFFQLVAISLSGQEHDFGIWGALEVKSKISEHSRLSLSTESRWFNNASSFDKQNTELAGSYSIGKNASIGLAYRLTQEQNWEQSIETTHRISADGSYEFKLGRIDLKIRAKYQQTYRELYIKERLFEPKRVARTKLSASYTIYASRLTPYCSSELFFPLQPESDDALLNKLRVSAGTEIRLSKSMAADLFYLCQINMPYPLSIAHIMGLGLSYKL